MRRQDTRDVEFEEFVRARRGSLLQTATVLTGGDRHTAEDLVQATLVKLYLVWPRARRTHLDAYARRVLVNGLIDERRRPFTRRERAVPEPPETAAPPSEPGVDATLLAALATLPAGMRAAVVLRHVDGLTVDEAADALGCSTGNIKSQTARGLDKLRTRLAPTSPQGAHP